jgi:hypothetical protein
VRIMRIPEFPICFCLLGFTEWGPCVSRERIVQNALCDASNEFSAIFTGDSDITFYLAHHNLTSVPFFCNSMNGWRTYLIINDVLTQILGTLRIQIIRPYRTSFLGSWHRERAYTREYIYNQIFGLEKRDETRMFGVETGIPVNGGEVEGETAVRFVLCWR